MDWRNNYVDVSCCMLFETIGDSEADSSVNLNDDFGGSSHEDTGLAEDDAFSCSSESDYYNDFDYPAGDYFDVGDDPKEVEEENFVVLVGDDYDHDEDDDEEDDAVDQVRINGANNCKAGDIKVLKRRPEWELGGGGGGVMTREPGPKRTKKQRVCGADFLNEPDKDRHFWETCLAS